MLPVKLTLQGIYSYQEQQTVDFNRLMEAQLFGIFGSVGSGKSTILEAIAFALYEDTERLNKRDQRGYNMMNLKSKEMLVDFEFTTGKESTAYRFVVTGKRNSKNFEDVKTKRSAYKWDNNQWQPIEATTAEEIVGLSYNNFRRTIIIPQGKFQEFLQLGDADRTKMMKEIFQLDRFELYHKVASVEKTNNEQVALLKGQLEHLLTVNSETLKDVENKLKEETLKLETYIKLQEKKQQEVTQLNQLAEVFEKMNVLKKRQAELLAQKESFEKLDKEIRDYEFCSIHFKSLLEKQKELETKQKTLNQTLVQNRDKQLMLHQNLTSQTTLFEKTKTEYLSRDKKQQEADSLQKMVQTHELKAKLKEIQESLVKGEKFLKENEATVAQNEKTIETESKKLTAFKLGMPNQSDLSAIKAWFLTKKHLTEQIDKNNTFITELKINSSQLQKQTFSNLPDFLKVDFELENFSLDNAIQKTIELFEISEKEIDKSEQAERHLLANAKLETMVKELKNGEPCPLCGSNDHPHPLNISDLDKEVQVLRLKIVDLKKEAKALLNTAQHLRDSNTSLKSLLNQQQKAFNEEKQLNEQLKMLHEQFVWKNYTPDSYAKVEADNAKAKAYEIEINKLDTLIENERKDLTKNQNLKEKALTKVQNLKTEFTAQDSALKTITQQISIELIKLHESKSTEELNNAKVQLLKALEEIEKNYQLQEKQLTELNSQINSLKGQISEQEKQRTEMTVESQQNSDKLALELSKSNYTIEQVQQILDLKINLEVEKNRLQTYQKELHSNDEQLNILIKETEGKSFNAEELKKITEELKQLLEQVKLFQQEIGKLKEREKKIQDDLKQKATLQKKLDQQLVRAENIKTLKNLFKASGFVNYISSVYLKNLCNAANARFNKLTKQQLKLELSDTNNFLVRDFLNDGKVRSVKTLSGGQTFQASLSLALALAESVQKQSQSKQNFFFLDEGFGTLDKDSLSLVFNTLKSLRKENRIVGIISHVEELQQEIDVYLKITNDPERGSIIER